MRTRTKASPREYFLNQKILSSPKLTRVEQSFTYLVTSFSTSRHALANTFREAKEQHTNPCVLVVPGQSIGVDLLAADFYDLVHITEDKKATENYEKHKDKRIPCYLMSIDLEAALNGARMPSEYEFRLIMFKP